MVARIIPLEQMPAQEYVKQVNASEAYRLREDYSQIVERHIHNGYESPEALHEALWAAPPLSAQERIEERLTGKSQPQQAQEQAHGYGR